MSTESTNWEPVELAPQEPLPFNPNMTFVLGKWRLAFEWMRLTLGGAPLGLSLGLYVEERGKQPKLWVAGNLKDAVAFAERCKLPPRRFAQLMGYALEHANQRTYKAEELKPWL